MEAMELKSMYLDKFGEFKHGESLKDQSLKFWWFWDSFEGVFNENMQEDQFWKKFIFSSFHLWGVFWELRKIRAFFGEGYFWKIVSDFQSFKMSSRSPKPTSFDPPNILNKLLSKNPTLTRRYEVNKFNLVTYFSL